MAEPTRQTEFADANVIIYKVKLKNWTFFAKENTAINSSLEPCSSFQKCYLMVQRKAFSKKFLQD